MPKPSSPSPDRFTLPGDIPDAGYWGGSARTAASARQRRAKARGEPPLLFKGGDRGVVADAQATDRGQRSAHHPQTPSSEEEGACRAAPGHAAPEDTRMLSHPAGRGWVPLSRDLGIPSEHASTARPGPVEHRTITIEHCFPDGSPDDPVAAVGCSQVFTRERRVRFLDHLAFKGNVRAAAALVGVSHETAYRKRRQDAAFAALWDAALVHARQYNESVLASRALDGVEVPVYYHGEIVGYRIVHDPRLLLAHLARLDRRVEGDGEDARAARAHAGRFDELLAGYAGHEGPDGFAEALEETRDCRVRGESPPVPPTRDEYVTWRRNQAIGGTDERKEARRMAAAAQAAGAEWDAWHEAALARIGAIVEGEAAEELDDAERTPTSGHPEPAEGPEPVEPERRRTTPAPARPEPVEGPEPVEPERRRTTPTPVRPEPVEAPEPAKSRQNPVTSVNPAPPAPDFRKPRGRNRVVPAR